jgi:hypothetical protein
MTETPKTAPRQPGASSLRPAAAKPAAPPKPTSPLRRLGCGLLLVLWFVLLLTPCGLFLIAMTGELTVPTGGLPEQELRIWLVMEADQRGLGISTGAPQDVTETAFCIQTDTRFALWAGRGQPASYCDCYTRADAASAWSLASVAQGACPGEPMS